MECDPSIKAIILKIDQEKHDYIVEDLDDQTLVIKESQLQKLKARLGEVSDVLFFFFCFSGKIGEEVGGRGGRGGEEGRGWEGRSKCMNGCTDTW